MFQKLIVITFAIALASANIFDFLNNFNTGGRQQQNQGVRTPQEYESVVLNSQCDKYLCPDTGLCVEAPKFCPCPYPSSQIRCFLPDGRFVCISKPAGEGISEKYNDPKTNWKIDAKDDNIRDCGWVNRAWRISMSL